MFQKPKANEVIYKEECLYCHQNIASNGLFIWLKNYQGYCEQHVMDQVDEWALFLYLKECDTSGFKSSKKLKLVEYDPIYKHFLFKSLECADYAENEEIKEIIDVISNCSSVMIQQRNKLLCENLIESNESSQTQNLFVDADLRQIEDPPKYSAEMLNQKKTKCFYCDKTDNLWLNLTDGVIACGRRQYDGSGGNNHAVEHYERTKHSITVKLGTITSDGSADVFSYAAGDMVTDMYLDRHLAHFDIDIAQLYVTDATMEQLQDEMNKSLILVSKNEYAEMLSHFHFNAVDSTNVGNFAVNIVGLNNVGNTCYINSLFQVLSEVVGMEEALFNRENGYLPEMFAANSNLMNDKKLNTIFEFQFVKLMRALIRYQKIYQQNVFQVVRTNLFKQSLAFLPDSNVFAQSHQQDVSEFFSYLTNKLENTGLDFGRLFRFRMADLLFSGEQTTCRVSFEHFLTVPLMLVGECERVDINELLRLLFSSKKIEGLASGRTVQSLFYTTPANLILHIGRYNYREEKILTQIEAPGYINLGDFILSEEAEESVCFGQQAEESKLDENIFGEVTAMGFDEAVCRKVCSQKFVKNVDNAIDWILRVEGGEELPNESAVVFTDVNKNKEKREEGEMKGAFELYGVVVHLGRSVQAGHYIAFVKKGGEWFCYDDEKVYYTEARDFEQLIGSGYLYFYKKI